MDTFRLLFGLGYWRKLVYLTRADIGLELCYKFGELEQFKGVLDVAGLDVKDYERQIETIKLKQAMLVYHQ